MHIILNVIYTMTIFEHIKYKLKKLNNLIKKINYKN